MRTRPLTRIIVCAAACILWANAGAKDSADNTYRGIPPGYDFPANQQTLLNYRDRVDVEAIRKHAWMVWAGLTHQPSQDQAAAFETWYSMPRAYDPNSNSDSGKRGLREHFATPRQFSTHADDPGESRLSQILFNRESYDYIRNNKMYLSKTVAGLNAKFNAQHTPPELRTVPAFPNAAVAVKTVWWPVRGEGISPVPVWDNDPANPIDSGAGNPKDKRGNGAETWKRVVAVVTPGTEMPAGNRTTMNLNGKLRQDSHAVPLSDFYHFKITPQILKAIDDAQIDDFGDVQVGDYAVLVAMHVSTREIPDWVWSTFWWHDRPDQGPYAQNRPREVQGVWQNYLMNTTLSMDTPREQDGSPKIVFNPYVEGKFSNGVLSNCMTCHNRSINAPLAENLCGALPITRGSTDLPPNDPRRATRTKLEFLWSLLFRPVPITPCAAGGSG